MLTKQLRELERQATVTKTRVQRFIELQTAINNQITQYGKADHQMADELDHLGDQLTNEEIAVLCNFVEYDEMEGVGE